MTIPHQAFPPSPYPQPSGTSVVSWRSLIAGSSYTFVALRVPGHGWFVTGRFTEPVSWDVLCFTLPPEDGRFLVLGVTAILSAGQVVAV